MTIPPTTPSPDPIDVEVLDRYLAGDCTPDEAATVERWVARRPENARRFEALRAQFGATAEKLPDYDPHTLWSRIARDIHRMDREAARSSGLHGGSRRSAGRAPLGVVPARSALGAPSSRRRRVMMLVARSAAAIAVVAVGVVVSRGVTTRRADPPVAAVATPSREYAAARGQRAELRLTDGTRVVLAPGSRLTVPVDYDSLARVVTLEGQGYFDVVHDDSKPFAVRAGNAYVRDLGTRFDVRAFPNEGPVRVVVTEGKVRLGRRAATDPGPLIVAGDIGRLSEAGPPTVTRGVDTTRLVAWTSGVLVFERTPVREVVAELARWYDMDVRLGDGALSGRTLTATLRDQSLSEVLRLVALGLNARVERRERVVTLHAKD
ncbi:MAG: FecR family protein [Gemmatimonadaceae bacterium]